MNIVILGSNPNLSLAELESVYPDSSVTPLANSVALVNEEVDISRLGGSVKAGDYHSETSSIELAFSEIEDYYSRNVPEGKLQLGVSLYDFKYPKLMQDVIKLKKRLVKAGMSVRVVNQPKDQRLNAAQIIHNKLLTDKGDEWIIVHVNNSFKLARTHSVQNIDEFASRDQARPARDARIGMLPPKLALILCNLAAGNQEGLTLLDPFCGTGVVLQEAMLLGCNVVGSDLSPDMVKASQTNLDWLRDKYGTDSSYKITLGDAQSEKWQKIDCVATETYLGPPLNSIANKQFFDQNLEKLSNLHEKFLRNVADSLSVGSKLALAIPAWYQPNMPFIHLPLVDHLSDIGYNLVEFENVQQPIIYHRDGQFVARHVVVLEKH